MVNQKPLRTHINNSKLCSLWSISIGKKGKERQTKKQIDNHTNSNSHIFSVSTHAWAHGIIISNLKKIYLDGAGEIEEEDDHDLLVKVNLVIVLIYVCLYVCMYIYFT